MSNYKKHSKSVQVVATAIYAAVSYLIIDGKFVPSNNNVLIWAAGLFLATSLLCYFVYDILDTLYDINVLGERMIILEENINEVAEYDLLIWERKISAKVHSQHPFPGVVVPFVMVQIYIGIMLVLALLAFPIATAVYLLWTTPITTHVWVKNSFLYVDIAWSLFSAGLLIYVARGQFKARSLARLLMQENASMKWHPPGGARFV